MAIHIPYILMALWNLASAFLFSLISNFSFPGPYSVDSLINQDRTTAETSDHKISVT